MDLMKRSSESEENLSGMTLVYLEAQPWSTGTNRTLVSSSDSSSEEPESDSLVEHFDLSIISFY